MKRSPLITLEDWWTVWIGFILIFLTVLGLLIGIPKPGKWVANPLEAIPAMKLLNFLGLMVCLGMLTTLKIWVMGQPVSSYLRGFLFVFGLAALAKLMGSQTYLKGIGLGYALWALMFGLLIANTIGTPPWIRDGARSELFIKIGLVLLVAEILGQKILALGGSGLVVAWVVTPVVVLFMWFFGTRIIRMTSQALVIVIACATSVCGVSAAIVSAAAARAKKEELTLVVGMTIIFTVAMMVGMPALSKSLGQDELVGGAWIGGTVDSTGAVVAAGALLGDKAEKVAAVVKMIQNVLIGIIAFCLVPLLGQEEISAVHKVTKNLHGWWFALAFVSIGLESNFRQLASQLVGGKPIVLYITGQKFNVLLTLLAACLAFGGILFTKPIL